MQPWEFKACTSLPLCFKYAFLGGGIGSESPKKEPTVEPSCFSLGNTPPHFGWWKFKALVLLVVWVRNEFNAYVGPLEGNQCVDFLSEGLGSISMCADPTFLRKALIRVLGTLG